MAISIKLLLEKTSVKGIAIYYKNYLKCYRMRLKLGFAGNLQSFAKSNSNSDLN